ncbi:MAG: hypothetical protein NVS2B4_02060 [Ramlibacter sp.]
METPFFTPQYRSAERHYSHAIAAEKAAWEHARNRLPGSSEFDAHVWAEWQRCVARSAAARRTLLDFVQITAGAVARPEATCANDAFHA